MPKVFISYRRSDTAGETGRLLDDLERRFGRGIFFRDIKDIDPGADFPDALDRALSQSVAMLVMIGPTWASVAGQQGRRLEQAADFVRTEVATALPRKDVLVIPVLLRGATIPAAEELPENLQALHRRNAFELSDTRWEYDIKRLGDALAKLPGLRTHRSNWRVLAAGGIALLAVVLFFLLYRGKRPFPSPVPTGKWAVVFGGDTTRQAAEDEINKAIKLQVPGLAIYHRENSYRSAAVFDSKEKATSMLAILKKLRPSAYVPPVSVDSWCKNAQEKDNSKGYVFYECSS